MKNKILLLERIVKKQGIKKKKRKAIAMYLSVCFLALSPDGVASYFGVKYSRVRHFVTVYGLRLKEGEFMNKMHLIAEEYNKSAQIEMQLNS
jgi:hypothetical protein